MASCRVSMTFSSSRFNFSSFASVMVPSKTDLCFRLKYLQHILDTLARRFRFMSYERMTNMGVSLVVFVGAIILVFSEHGEKLRYFVREKLTIREMVFASMYFCIELLLKPLEENALPFAVE